MAVIVSDNGVSLPLAADSLIGRLPTEDPRVVAGAAQPIVVPDPTRQISRCHLLLRIRQWQIEAIDLGAQNGTFFWHVGQWHRILPGLAVAIADGQHIRLGSREMTIHRLRR